MWKSLVLITLVASLTITSQIFLKRGLREIGEMKPSGLQDFFSALFHLIQNKFIIIGIFIAATGAFFWLIVISKMDLTVAFPISGAIFFVLLFLVSWLFLGETITVVKVLGVLLILLGAYMILNK